MAWRGVLLWEATETLTLLLAAQVDEPLLAAFLTDLSVVAVAQLADAQRDERSLDRQGHDPARLEPVFR